MSIVHRENWNPFDAGQHRRQVASLVDLLSPGSRRVIDLGCGDGRVILPLAERGCVVTGVDCDPAAVGETRARLEQAGTRAEILEADFLAPDFDPPGEFDAVLCLGNTLLTLIEHDQLDRFFAVAARLLADGGRLIVDDAPHAAFREIAEGNWQEGVSEDGSMQMVWLGGDPVFALRHEDAVDETSWVVTDEDRAQGRLRRAWSVGEYAWFAGVHGFAAPEHQGLASLLIFRLRERRDPRG